MPTQVLRVDSDELEGGFAQIRRELDLPLHHSDAAQTEAELAAKAGPRPFPSDQPERTDLRAIPFVAIDPPGSRDLDQAYWAEATATGFRVLYAIADVSAFVAPDGALAAEALERGVTYYAPDIRLSLYPEAIGEGAASLLPDVERPALVWTIDLDADGAVVHSRLARALVRCRAALDYATVQQAIDAGTAEEPLRLLKQIGRLRMAIERHRGGVSLNIPAQEVNRGAAGYRITYDVTLDVERWNAQISLMAGMCAAQHLLDGGTGLLRTLPPPAHETIEELRRRAQALGVGWSEAVDYPEFVRTLDPAVAADAALLVQATKVFRGAGYLAFHEERPVGAGHAAVAAEYAHVTAPLRRVADRYVNEILLAHDQGVPIPEWVLSELDGLPRVLAEARRREGALERSIIDLMEATCMADRIGERFDGVIVRTLRDGRSEVQLADPAVRAPIDGEGLVPGTSVRVVLHRADPAERQVEFVLA